jgi:putative addiction module CopG family antidote
MTIQLPEDLESYVQAIVRSGRFASEQEAITEALRLFRQAEEKLTQKVSPEPDIPEPAWQRVMAIMGSVPDSVFDRIPADGSEQLDHHIYGSPRRPRP